MNAFRDFPWRALVITVVLLFIAILCLGCQTVNKKSYGKPVDNTGTITSQAKKDQSILGSADTIDALVKPAPEPIPEQVKAETNAIRAAIQAAPAVDVEKALKSTEAKVAEVQAALDKTTEKLQKAEEKGSLAIRITLFSISTLVAIAGVVIAFTGSQIPLFGPKMGFGVFCGGVAGFALSVAYDWSVKHPVWTGIIIVSFLCVSVGIGIANYYWHKENDK